MWALAKKLEDDWPESISSPRALRKVLRASTQSCPVQVELLCATALCQRLYARLSAQVLCASVSAQVACASAVCKLQMQVSNRQLLRTSCGRKQLPCASCPAPIAASLRKCLCASCLRKRRVQRVVILQPELRDCAPRTTFVLKICDFPAEAAGAHSAYYFRTEQLRFSSRSCREPGGNRTHDRQDSRARARTTRQVPKTSPQPQKAAKRPQLLHLDHADPRRHRKNAKILEEFLYLDRADPRRGFIRAPQPRKQPHRFPHRIARADQKSEKHLRVFASRPRRSPQRVARGDQKSKKKNLEFLHLDHADPRKVLPRGPRNLNLTYIAANAEALRAWLYALGSMHLALCTWLYALGSMHLALCTWLYALGSMHSALCTRLCALGSVHSALCTWLICTWLYLHLALFALEGRQKTLSLAFSLERNIDIRNLIHIAHRLTGSAWVGGGGLGGASRGMRATSAPS